MKIKQNIPNFLTLCNLLCGCLAIVSAFDGNLVWSAYLVGIAAVFDFFDGMVARALKVTSPIGKDLDSLADMVTFGVVPGLVMFKMLTISRVNSLPNLSEEIFQVEKYTFSYTYFAFLIPIFSAIRLAKFNNDTRQTESFIGLPTPANAILICSMSLIAIRYPIHFANSIVPSYEGNYFVVKLLNSSVFLLITSFILSFLLVAELPLFALKFKSFGWKGNEIRYVFLGLSLVLVISLKLIGIPLIIILYILLSLINNLLKKKNFPSP